MPEVPRITVQDVKAKLDSGASIAVVDSRPWAYYVESRIPGAISLPFDDMAPPYPDLAGYDEIATYCT
jgi:rhodanese-related sulfurtransferase